MREVAEAILLVLVGWGIGMVTVIFWLVMRKRGY